MSFRRAVAANLGVQSLGPACSFLTVFMIARLGGPAQQGEFAQLKAWADFMFAIGCFGFPQGFVYTINKLGASPSALARWSRVYSVAFTPLAVIAGYMGLKLGFIRDIGPTPYRAVSMLGLAAAMLVLQGLWRGVYLTHNSRVPFALFTILPAITLLIATGIGMTINWRKFAYIILLSAIATVAISSRAMSPIIRSAEYVSYRKQPWRAILSNGLHSFLQSALQTAQPMAAYALLNSFGAANQQVGFLSVGLLIVQGMSVPVTMVAPLLFARWTSIDDHGLLARLHSFTCRYVGIGIVMGGVLAFAARFGVPFVFGSKYEAAVVPTELMLLTLPLVWHVRVLAPALHAQGHPMINTVAGMTRLGAFGLGTVALTLVARNPLMATGAAWAVAEVVAAAWTLVNISALTAKRESMVERL